MLASLSFGARSTSTSTSPTAATQPKMGAERQRDVLFGAGCGLLCFGLFPFRTLATTTAESTVVEHAAGSVVETGFDEATQLLSLAFAGLGLMCATLSCLAVPRAALRWMLPLLLLPLLLTSTVSTLRIYHHFTASDLVGMVSKSGFSVNGELLLEARVNHLYCSASIQNVCARDTVDQAKAAFPTLQWPSNAGEEMTVAQACARDFVMRGPTSLSTGCRVCRQEPVIDSDGDVVLKLIKPSPAASKWCGEYLTHSHMRGTRRGTPYRHHRSQVLDNLDVLYANRVSSVRLMMVLEWFAFPAIVALLWWCCVLSGKTSTSSARIQLSSNIV
ncbi:hypothetical protein Poli38472_005178 [Pythium oligandrum]|uniref:Uncharacterized protein n=1 Tax=Pythium oligandrum TaxID=41045 RepID=A0A8K1CG37_PYTOL|nr:hypothetical protein Poli38472_005178 [Pythium oligandrum]|eukprot:TMW62560.1 hypothetical protein Poli38472_005178 [Pythium oligandrum]